MCRSSSRRGITLVEVLISIFVLGVGLLSVLSLFTAGRDVEAKAIRDSAARAYADVIAPRVVEEWSRVGNWRWTDSGGPDPDDWLFWDAGNVAAIDARVGFPVVIDPYGLNADTVPGQGDDLQLYPWWWHRFVEAPPPFIDILNDPPSATRMPFRRTSVFATQPPPSSAFLAQLADPDDVEYRLDQNDQTAPPSNAFEFGRRARGTDFTPALFVAQYPFNTSTVPKRIEPGVEVTRWLLVFYKLAVPDMAASPATRQPEGFLRFDIDEAQGELLTLNALENSLPSDSTSLRRSLRPGRWILLVHMRDANEAWKIHWAKIVSQSKDDRFPDPTNPSFWRQQWLVTIDPPLPNLEFDASVGRFRAFTFESLLHVRRLDATPHTLVE